MKSSMIKTKFAFYNLVKGYDYILVSLKHAIFCQALCETLLNAMNIQALHRASCTMYVHRD
jgi:hypothetical protein